jgi:hypothetical protein
VPPGPTHAGACTLDNVTYAGAAGAPAAGAAAPAPGTAAPAPGTAAAGPRLLVPSLPLSLAPLIIAADVPVPRFVMTLRDALGNARVAANASGAVVTPALGAAEAGATGGAAAGAAPGVPGSAAAPAGGEWGRLLTLPTGAFFPLELVPSLAAEGLAAWGEAPVWGAAGPEVARRNATLTYLGRARVAIDAPCDALTCALHVRVRGAPVAGSPFY